MNPLKSIVPIFVAAILSCTHICSASTDTARGLIVESVARNSESQAADLRSGDVIVTWSTGESRGDLDTPFELITLEAELSPRHRITLEGQRSGAVHRWIMGPDRWGIETRPELTGDLSRLYSEGKALGRAGNLSAAAVRFMSAADVADKQAESRIGAWFRFHAASLLAQARKWKDSDAAFSTALHTNGLPDALTANIARAWADTLNQRDLWDSANTYYKESIAACQRAGGLDFTMATDLDEMATIALRRDDVVLAEQYSSRALTIVEKLAPESLAAARSLNSAGTVTRFTRTELGKAEDYYRRAMAIETKLAPERLDFALTLNHLGILSWYQGELDAAEKWIRQALSIREKLAPGSLDVASSYHELGTVADLQGDYTRAESCYQKALSLRNKLAPASLLVADTVHNLGGIAEETGHLNKADEYYKRELEIGERLEPETLDMAGTYNNLGYLARDRKDWDKAEAYEQHALEIENRIAPNSLWVAETLHNLGDTATQRGNLEQAQQNYQKAVAIREKLATGSGDHANSLIGLASVLHKQGKLHESEQRYEEALTALEHQADHLGGSADVESGFRARHAAYYKQYSDLLLEEHRPDSALQVLERSHARMLLEMMAAAHLNVSSGADPELLRSKQKIESDLRVASQNRLRALSGAHGNAQLSEDNAAIDALLKKHQDVVDQIRLRSPNYAALVQPEPLTAKQIQDELIDENTMLLEYALGEPKSHLLIVQKNGVQSYDIAGRAQIESAARRVYRELTFPNQLDGRNGARAQELLSRAGHEFEEAARTLSRMVLEPAAKELGNKRLLIVSDGALHYIPFAALPVRASDTSFVPLVAEHEIVNLPSASVLAVLRDQEIRRTKPTKTVAVLADPVFDALDPRVPDQASRPNATAALPMNTRMLSPGNDSMSKMMRSVADIRGIQPGSSRSARDLHLSRLWFTRVEADRILAATPKGQGSEIVDFDANRAAATSDKLSEYRIVHFATHGLLDSRNPELSGLVFSMVDKQGRTQDGFLDLQDIYNLNLPADMVVLSACETGLGKEIDGEGMIGLTRGFMYAGASRVVASLWRVSDIATAELMSRFYQAMERDGMRPAAALRHAQVEMWKERRWKMPYYWAAFQIHGEWN